MQNPFVTTDWLAQHLADPDLVVVDASWHLPNSARNAQAEYLAGHIPGAVFFDIDAIADAGSSLPHMLPAPDIFSRLVGALGIGQDMRIVIYDEIGLFSAPRVWWTFRAFGAEKLFLLAGGGPQWRQERRPLQAGLKNRPKARFQARLNLARIADFERVRAHSRAGTAQIVDARPAPRFHAEMPEPRPGLRAGHIPNSRNVPVDLLVQNGRLKPEQDLKSLFEARDLDLTRPLVTTCGSGVTAATLALALELAGAPSVAVYDGSWAEWGSRPEAEVEA